MAPAAYPPGRFLSGKDTPIPLFFFNIAGAVFDPDVVGVELPSLDEARLVAAKHVGEILRDRPGLAWQGEELRVEVTDAAQLVMFTVITVGVNAPAARPMKV